MHLNVCSFVLTILSPRFAVPEKVGICLEICGDIAVDLLWTVPAAHIGALDLPVARESLSFLDQAPSGFVASKRSEAGFPGRS